MRRKSQREIKVTKKRKLYRTKKERIKSRKSYVKKEEKTKKID
jgi:hypothetical protein